MYTEQKAYTVGIIAYALLLILSVIFYQERVILMDNAFYLFDMINTENFCIQRYRIISILPQIPAFIAIHLGMPLKLVCILFSAGYSLFYFIIYLVTGWGLKKHRLALTLLILNTLIISHTFFWNISELFLGLGLSVLYFALLSQREFMKLRVWHLLLSILMLTLITSSHPLIIFPFLFTLLFLFRKREIDKQTAIYILLSFALLYLINRLFFTDLYDAEKLDAAKNIKNLFPHYFNLESNYLFLKDLIRNYQMALVLWIMSVIYYLRKKMFTDFIIVNLFLAGFLFLVNVSFPRFVTSFYMENMYLPVSVVLGLIFTFEIAADLRTKYLNIVFILIIVSACLTRIFFYKSTYEQRIDWYQNYFSINPYKKIALPSDIAPNEILLMSWPVTFEVALWSTIEYKSTYGLVFLDELNLRPAIKPVYKNELVSVWIRYPYSELSGKYFKLDSPEKPYLIKYDL